MFHYIYRGPIDSQNYKKFVTIIIEFKKLYKNKSPACEAGLSWWIYPL